jgi:hypothetical protein
MLTEVQARNRGGLEKLPPFYRLLALGDTSLVFFSIFPATITP